MKVTNPDKRYFSAKHIKYSCQYHVVFCPKYRRCILVDEISERLIKMFKEIAEEYEFNIIDLEIMPDHVHLLLECNPRFGVMKCVHKLKGITASKIRDEFPELKSKLPSLWTRACFISSVGSVSLEVVKKYIREQDNV